MRANTEPPLVECVGFPNYLKCTERTPYENRPSPCAPQMQCGSKGKENKSHKVHRRSWINQKQSGDDGERTFQDIGFLPEPSSGTKGHRRHAESRR